MSISLPAVVLVLTAVVTAGEVPRRHGMGPGGLHDLPKPDSATEKKALALVSGGKETKNTRSCRSRLSPLSFPNLSPSPQR